MARKVNVTFVLFWRFYYSNAFLDGGIRYFAWCLIIFTKYFVVWFNYIKNFCRWMCPNFLLFLLLYFFLLLLHLFESFLLLWVIRTLLLLWFCLVLFLFKNLWWWLVFRRSYFRRCFIFFKIVLMECWRMVRLTAYMLLQEWIIRKGVLILQFFFLRFFLFRLKLWVVIVSLAFSQTFTVLAVSLNNFPHPVHLFFKLNILIKYEVSLKFFSYFLICIFCW